LNDYIEENLAKNFIRHSKSSADVPIRFVKQKGGSLQTGMSVRCGHGCIGRPRLSMDVRRQPCHPSTVRLDHLAVGFGGQLSRPLVGHPNRWAEWPTRGRSGCPPGSLPEPTTRWFRRTAGRRHGGRPSRTRVWTTFFKRDFPERHPK
jgi:hypothetical protein